MASFKYAPMFQLGPDTTQYYTALKMDFVFEGNITISTLFLLTD